MSPSAAQCPADVPDRPDGFLGYAMGPVQETGALQETFGAVGPGQAVVRMSTGRQRINSEALGAAAQTLAQAAQELAATQAGLLALQLEVALAWAPLSGHAARAAEELEQAQGQLAELVLEAAEDAARLKAAQQAYEHAEEYAQKLSDTLRKMEAKGLQTLWEAGADAGPLGLGVALVGTFALAGVDWRVRGTAAETRNLIMASGVPREGILDAARMIRMQGRRQGLGLERVVDFREAGEPEEGTREHGSSTAFLMGRINRAAAADDRLDGAGGRAPDVADTAHVDVTVVHRPDGTTGYLVSVPGSDFQNLTDPDEPNGLMSIGDSLAMDEQVPMLQSTALMQSVDQALRQAGAGQGASVMLTGFSQGGMAAMNLAANREFGTRYQVAAVTTYGAPVQTLGTAAPGVQVLHVRDRNDLVPVLSSDQTTAGDSELVAYTNTRDGSLLTHDGGLYEGAGEAVDQALQETAEGRGYQQAVDEFLPAGSSLQTRTFESRAELYDDPSAALSPQEQDRLAAEDERQLEQDWRAAHPWQKGILSPRHRGPVALP